MAIIVFKNVVGVTTITLAKPINNALIAPNDLVLPSQAMEVNVATISKLIGIIIITPSSKCVLVIVLVAHVSFMTNK